MTAQPQAPHCPHSELAVGWALHVLEPAEEVLVADHLPECDECTRTVAETELVGATLGLAVPQENPSAELEQRILALTSSPQVPPEPSPKPAPPPTPQPAPDIIPRPAQPGGRALPPISASRRATRRRPRRDPLCVPELLKLISVAVLVFIVAAAVVFLAIP
ncbi:MAG: hypothetical protein ACRDRV_21835 [Pseudonocardiaceae bacterium]